MAYCLRITDLDPIRYDLLFERFLNPSRISMPDIDMDFDSRYRDEMIRYAAQKYGRDRVAQIVTFSTIKARAAVRDAARVLGHPYGVGDKVAKAMPPLVMGRDTPLRACLDLEEKFADGYKMAGELRDMYATDPVAKEVIDVAKGLEGLRRQDGIHAAAVVITREPLTDYLPIQRKPEAGTAIPRTRRSSRSTRWAVVESLGLLKMDFLGIRNLDVITDTLELIEETRGITVDIDGVPLDDRPDLRAAAPGRHDRGVPARGLGDARPDPPPGTHSTFEDVAALVALYRPGPMAVNMHNDYADIKNGRKPVTYFHPDAEEILADTYGLMIYQESVMRVAQRFAGYSLAEADNLRKACGKKIRELMAKERSTASCRASSSTGYGEALGTQLFDIIERFADYAFNKSHSYGYGLIAYQTAYLKANYPTEYLACLLTSVKANLDKAAVYLAECRVMDIEVTVPDVNRARSDFAPYEIDGRREITFGLSAVRNVGSALVDLMVSERDARRPLRRLLRLRRTGQHPGAEQADRGVPDQGRRLRLDGPSPPGTADGVRADRRRHAGPASRARHGCHVACSVANDGPLAFDERTAIPDVDFPKKERLSFEKEMLGLYVSDHPLIGAEATAPPSEGRLLPRRPRGQRGRRPEDRRRRDHQPPAEVDQEGRPHGRLHAGGPPVARSRSWSSRRRWPTAATSSPTTRW